jgi:NADH-quinone oxidoreductase subunit M
MTFHDIPWLELAVLVALVGAVLAWFLRASMEWASAACGVAFTFAVCEWLPHLMGWAPSRRATLWLTVDAFSAPLLALTALLHLLVAASTPRSIGAKGFYALLLASLAVQLATFGCTEPWLLVCLLALGAFIPWVELLRRGKPTLLFSRHMAVFVGLLAAGWALLQVGLTAGGQVLLMAAVLVRCGTFPAHAWLPGLFDHARFGTALVFAAPLVGVYAAVRLVVPEAPEWVLKGLGFFSLVTAAAAAGMAMVQREARRLFAYLFLSHASLVLVGVEVRSAESLTGAFSLWLAASMSLVGLGLVLRAAESRFGRLSLEGYRGLYRHSPTLAGCFLLMGLAAAGFPGTLGFISSEILVDGALSESAVPGLVAILAGTMNGIAVMRAYFRLFAGPSHSSTIPLGITTRERLSVVILAVLLLAGGLYPQAAIASRHAAARAVLKLPPVAADAGH